MKFNNFFKDPIYGEILFEEDPLFFELVSSKEFKRLKNIKQLGLCENVFHTATHNRFSHSIGVFNLAKLFLRHLNIDLKSYEAKITMCAALLHDIGHGPFSHVFEKISKIEHEDVTKKIIDSKETEVNKVLIKYKINPKDVSNVYDFKALKPWMWQVVCSIIDADRMDYILRDSYMIGTRYGTIDIPLLISRTKINEEGYIIHSYRNKNIIQAFLQSRIYMREDVYENNNVLLYEWVLVNIFNEMKKKKKTLFKNKAKIIYWEFFEFLIMDDHLHKDDIKNVVNIDDNMLIFFIKSIYSNKFGKKINSLINSFLTGDGLEWKNVIIKNEEKNLFEDDYGIKLLKLEYNLIDKIEFENKEEKFKNDILLYDVKDEKSNYIWFSTLILEKNDNIKWVKLTNKNFIRKGE